MKRKSRIALPVPQAESPLRQIDTAWSAGADGAGPR